MRPPEERLGYDLFDHIFTSQKSKIDENGHNPGARAAGVFLGLLGFPWGPVAPSRHSRCLKEIFVDFQESSEDVLIAAQETSVVSMGFFRASQRHLWEARNVETV